MPSSEGPAESALSGEERERRSQSFGGAAELYERYRPGPPVEAVEWMLPDDPGTVVDLGAGTGAMTRLLVGRAQRVVAVEPDARMRDVLVRAVPDAIAVDGRGESMPVASGEADAVVASSSWHWMELVPTLDEVARVLSSRGVLGAVWAGPDLEGPFMQQAQAFLARGDSTRSDGEVDLSSAILDPVRQQFALEIPDGMPFATPEHFVHRWEVPLNADELIGLMGTLSWVILTPQDRREQLFEGARRVLRDALGVDGDVTVDVTYRADAWRTRIDSR
jgi:SAM-dependent methyltransferase